KGLPAEVAVAYKAAVEQFLPNHPFLRNGEFAGPAFRAYALAAMPTHTELWVNAEILLEDGKWSPTPLFAGFYRHISGGVARGRHVGFLYEAAVARFGLEAGVVMTVVSPVGGSAGDNQTQEEVLRVEPENRDQRDVDS